MSTAAITALIEFVKVHFDVKTQAEIARVLGRTQPQIATWQNGSGPTRKSTWHGLLKRLVDEATREVIWPLVEFSAVKPERSGGGWMFHADKTVTAALKGQLDSQIGLYLFYDSAGRAVYVGKATKNLWIESKQRLAANINRAIYLPKRTGGLVMGDVTAFVSAYGVGTAAAIHNLEALLLRAFGNDHANTNSANFFYTLR